MKIIRELIISKTASSATSQTKPENKHHSNASSALNHFVQGIVIKFSTKNYMNEDFVSQV